MDLKTVLVLLTIIILVLIITVIWALKLKSQLSLYLNKYSKIIDIDKAVESALFQKSLTEKETTQLKKKTERETKALINKAAEDIESLKSQYKNKKIIFNNLVKEAAIYNEEIELASLGFYKPHFDFGTSDEFKNSISSIKAEQKLMTSHKDAIYCNMEWTVEGSRSKGRTMTNRGIRLTARAFNNECESAMSNARWNNAERMEQRIIKAFDAINKLNETNRIFISDDYLNLKIRELRLTHEYREKKQNEKEEQAEIRRQMREEAKLEQELERAIKEEDKYLKLLSKAQHDAEKTVGDDLKKLNDKIKQLDIELVNAKAKSERAKSMAQQTKLGHVYIISNIGSFGNNVFKIGMTRRLDPLDRIKELGDASVPFTFDVHAMIYTEDAPSLEKSLHRVFALKRVNLVNNRKEFFNVNLDEIEFQAKKIDSSVEFVETAEARQFRESEAIRALQAEKKSGDAIMKQFPESI